MASRIAIPGEVEAATTMQRMRILLQQKETGLYFKDLDSWARQQAEAMDFVSSSAAMDFCKKNRINGVQMVLKFAEQAYELVLPVLAARESSRPAPPPQ
jgi:hypothetical protein